MAGNQNAKAQHFNNVKMQLNIATQEKAKLIEKLRCKEKSEEDTLRRISDFYNTLFNVIAPHILGNQHSKQVLLADNGFASCEGGLFKIKEILEQCEKAIGPKTAFANSTNTHVNKSV